MSAGIYNITIEQGATFTMPITYKDEYGAAVNLSGYTARMQIRTSAQGQVMATPTVTITDAAAGEITVSMTVSETSALLVTGASHSNLTQCVYDLELVASAGEVIRLLNGICWISPEVTKP